MKSELFSPSLPSSKKQLLHTFFTCYFYEFDCLFFGFHTYVILCSTCHSLSGLSHLTLYPQGISMLPQMTGFPSFSRLNDILLYIYFTYFFIHLYVDRYLGYFYILAAVSKATMNMGLQMSLRLWRKINFHSL